MGAKSSITSTCLGYKYAVFFNRSDKSLSLKSTPQMSWYSFLVTTDGSTVAMFKEDVLPAAMLVRWVRKLCGVKAVEEDGTDAEIAKAKAAFREIVMLLSCVFVCVFFAPGRRYDQESTFY